MAETTTNYIKMTMGYENTDFKRDYELDIEHEYIAQAKQKVLDINSSLEGGTAGGFSSFFVGNNGEHLKKIESLKLFEVTEEILDLGE